MDKYKICLKSNPLSTYIMQTCLVGNLTSNITHLTDSFSATAKWGSNGWNFKANGVVGFLLMKTCSSSRLKPAKEKLHWRCFDKLLPILILLSEITIFITDPSQMSQFDPKGGRAFMVSMMSGSASSSRSSSSTHSGCGNSFQRTCSRFYPVTWIFMTHIIVSLTNVHFNTRILWYLLSFVLPRLISWPWQLCLIESHVVDVFHFQDLYHPEHTSQIEQNNDSTIQSTL